MAKSSSNKKRYRCLSIHRHMAGEWVVAQVTFADTAPETPQPASVTLTVTGEEVPYEVGGYYTVAIEAAPGEGSK